MSIDKRGIFMNSGLKSMARREVARKLQTINVLKILFRRRPKQLTFNLLTAKADF